MRIGPAMRLFLMTLRKKPFLLREKPLCEKAAWRSDKLCSLGVVELSAAAVTTRPPKL
jgi:hypothetical protein